MKTVGLTNPKQTKVDEDNGSIIIQYNAIPMHKCVGFANKWDVLLT